MPTAPFEPPPDGSARLDALPVPVLELGADGALLQGNNAFAALALALAPADHPPLGAAGATSAALPWVQGPARDALLQALAARADFRQPLMLSDAKGHARWFELVAHWLPEHARFIAVLHEVTQARSTEIELRADLERFALLANSVPALIAYYETERFTCLYANRQYAATFGFTPENIIGHTYSEVVGEAAGKMIAGQVEMLLRERRTASYEREMTDAGGARRWLEVSLVPHVVAGDQVVGVFVLISDITSHHLAEAALRESEDRMAMFMEASAEGILFHSEGVITDANQPLLELLDTARESVIGRRLLDFIAPGHVERVSEVLATKPAITYEIELLTASGRHVPVEVIGRTILRRGETLRMAVVRDIRDRLAAQARIHHLAHHDTLTGLPNRMAFMQRLEQELAERRGKGPHLALLFIDLDHFKRINDSLGHLEGDALLRTVAERITRVLRASDMVGRFGGDEFTVLLPEVANRQAVEEVAHKLLETVSQPMMAAQQSIAVTPSIGVAMYPNDGEQSSQLVKHADTAMYVAKATGRAACRFFESAMAGQAYAAIVLEGQLAKALQDDQFSLLLQPRLRAAGGHLAGVQAQLRWHHPQRGLLGPDAFAEVALERNLMQPIALWALGQVQRLQSRWREQGRRPLPIALSLATMPLSLSQVTAAVEQVWSDAAQPPVLLGLELGDSVLMDSPKESRRLLGHLRALGVQVTIDDFGAGAVPLIHLKGLPLHGITLGPALVAGVSRDAAGTVIARALIGLAQGLGLVITADGVDNDAQRSWLAAEGCTLLQGPLVARPMPVQEFEAWLGERNFSPSEF